jgi:hypothetical protein
MATQKTLKMIHTQIKIQLNYAKNSNNPQAIAHWTKELGCCEALLKMSNSYTKPQRK